MACPTTQTLQTPTDKNRPPGQIARRTPSHQLVPAVRSLAVAVPALSLSPPATLAHRRALPRIPIRVQLESPGADATAVDTGLKLHTF
jgi:hypothetical protein